LSIGYNKPNKRKSKEMAKFKQAVLDKIKEDADLFSAVAKAIGIKPTSLPQTLERNGNTLNQYSVVKAVSDYLEQDPKELLELENL
jgi:hypothetical protein